MRARKLLSATAMTAAALLLGSLAAPAVDAQEPDGISSLRGKRPNLPNLDGIVVNRSNLRVLGKALFWDISVGSDGVSCASCHFHGGSDIRITNQYNAGGTESGEHIFDNGHDVNQTATADQFPFFRLDPNTPLNNSDLRDPDNVDLDDDDRFSSNGTFNGDFVSQQNLEDGDFSDDCTIDIANIHSNFQLPGPIATRKVEPRHTPTVINAVFNFRNFWDGRANNIFNGLDPFGQRTNNAGVGGVLKLNGSDVELEELAIRHASLASQAVGPVLSTFEMSCADRPFAFVGRKILSQTALEFQKVDSRDSVFRASGLVNTGGNGLTADYEQLVKAAFDPSYWDDDRFFDVDRTGGSTTFTEVADETQGFKLIEQNFPLFWGLALLEYQSTLISDASDFDRNRLSASARRGKAVFEDKGKCVACHKGPLLSGAAITDEQNNVLIEGMFLATETNDRFAALYDDSFYNIGVSPTEEDFGLGGEDPFGNPLSFTRQLTQPGGIVDQKNLDPDGDGDATDAITFEEEDATELQGLLLPPLGKRDAVDGAFKTPILRNVGTTPPYMHDGSMATLEQVIDFYNRGGNRLSTPNDSSTIDTTGGGPGGFPNNLDADIGILDLTQQEKGDLKNFLLALTDRRVLCHRAPFDHPELPLHLGHDNADLDGDDRADDIVKVLPAVGSRGYSSRDCFANNGDLFGNLQDDFNGLLQ
ncbi:MAG: cytochrome-c peroxidase [Geminicoccaceae bacterium]